MTKTRYIFYENNFHSKVTREIFTCKKDVCQGQFPKGCESVTRKGVSSGLDLCKSVKQ